MCRVGFFRLRLRGTLAALVYTFPVGFVEVEKAGGVAARPPKAFDEAGADRIGDLREHDGHSTGYL